MSSMREVVVLVGPKGCGKTTIGGMLEAELGLRFLEVEAIARRVLEEMGGTIDERYARRAFEAIVEAIAELPGEEGVVIETTGASDQTDWFLGALRERFALRLVRVRAPAAACAARIAARDSSRQVAVSPEMIAAMHARSEALELPWDAELENDPPLELAAVRRALGPLLGLASPSHD